MQKQELETLFNLKKKIPMRSKAGRISEKLLFLNGLVNTKEYIKTADKKLQTTVSSVISNDESNLIFKTVSRDKKNSYLLRYAIQPNINVNYYPNTSNTFQTPPKYSVSSSKFMRRIDVDTQRKDKYLNVQSPIKNERCVKSHSRLQTKPLLTTRDFMSAKKETNSLDFEKQITYRKESAMRSTGFKSLKSSGKVTDRETANQAEKHNQNKIHVFESYSPHKYLQFKVEQTLPITDLLKTNFNRAKQRWSPSKSHLKFGTFTNQIKTRYDRAEKQLGLQLDYNPQQGLVRPKTCVMINYDRALSRKQNLVVSPYPVRMSLRNDYNLRKQVILKNQVSSRQSQI